MTLNIEHIVFDKVWFNNNQDWLLYILNHKLLKYMLRPMFSINTTAIINYISPNSYSTINNNYSGILNVFEDNIFANVLYYKFKYIWNTFHMWDMNIANKVKPQWNLGFDTINLYTDDGINTGCDGWTRVTTSEVSFGIIINMNGTHASTTTDEATAYIKTSSFTTDLYEELGRVFWAFDTSIFGNNPDWIPTAVDVIAYVQNEAHELGAPSIYIVKSNQVSPGSLVPSDHQLVEKSTMYGGPFAIGGSGFWKTHSISKDCINLTGSTKLAGLVHWDYLGFSPIWANNERSLVAYDTTHGNEHKPYLKVTYDIVSPIVMMI